MPSISQWLCIGLVELCAFLVVAFLVTVSARSSLSLVVAEHQWVSWLPLREERVSLFAPVDGEILKRVWAANSHHSFIVGSRAMLVAGSLLAFAAGISFIVELALSRHRFIVHRVTSAMTTVCTCVGWSLAHVLLTKINNASVSFCSECCSPKWIMVQRCVVHPGTGYYFLAAAVGISLVMLGASLAAPTVSLHTKGEIGRTYLPEPEKERESPHARPPPTRTRAIDPSIDDWEEVQDEISGHLWFSPSANLYLNAEEGRVFDADVGLWYSTQLQTGV